MANRNLNARLIQRNDTGANWIATDPVLLKGEMGIEIDTKKFKIGDGIKTWTQLSYATVTPEEIAELGGGDMVASVYATIDPENGFVDRAITATKLSVAKNIGLTGDVTGTVATDFAGDVSIATVLATLVTAGTATKVTVNEKGLVTAIATLEASDIPEITADKITDLGTAATKDTGILAGNVVILESDGKINEQLLPRLALTEVFVVNNETEMLALVAQPGDFAIRTDESKTYILSATPSTELSNWLELKVPGSGIEVINGKSGASVTLTTSDIAEGDNLYYTQERFNTAFATAIATVNSTDLADSDTILRSTDTFIFNGGTA